MRPYFVVLAVWIGAAAIALYHHVTSKNTQQSQNHTDAFAALSQFHRIPNPDPADDPLSLCNSTLRSAPMFRSHPILSSGTLEIVEGRQKHVIQLPEGKKGVQLPGLLPCEGFTLTGRDANGRVIAQFSVPYQLAFDSWRQITFRITNGIPFLDLEGWNASRRTVAAINHEAEEDPRLRDSVEFAAVTHNAYEPFTSGRESKDCSQVAGHEDLGCLAFFHFSRSRSKTVRLVNGATAFDLKPMFLEPWLTRDQDGRITETFARVEIVGDGYQATVAYITDKTGKYGPFYGHLAQ